MFTEKMHSVYLIDPVYPVIPKYSKSLNLSWIMITDSLCSQKPLPSLPEVHSTPALP